MSWVGTMNPSTREHITISRLEKLTKSLKGFSNPKVKLEQYSTDNHVASRMISLIESEKNAIYDKFVLDLGCGSGILTITASILDPLIIFAIDIDKDVFSIFKENLSSLGHIFDIRSIIEPIIMDSSSVSKAFRINFDSVISNPPFGTKNNQGIDCDFIKSGLSVSNNVFSLHKTSTRSFLTKKMNGELMAQISFKIPKQFHFHNMKEAFIDVDLLHFEANKI